MLILNSNKDKYSVTLEVPELTQLLQFTDLELFNPNMLLQELQSEIVHSLVEK